MPYKSRAQRGYMHANHPKIAKRWDAEERKKKSKKKAKRNTRSQTRRSK